MLYHLYELHHAATAPLRAVAQWQEAYWRHPLNPWAGLEAAQGLAASWQLLEETTRRHAKPAFGVVRARRCGRQVPVREQVIWQRPFCDLRHFAAAGGRRLPRVLVVAPMSGHHATLLRDTVQTLLHDHDVCITDWTDARMTPLAAGRFDLEDFVDCLMDMLRDMASGAAGGRTDPVHVLAVCQPAPLVLAAVSRLAQDKAQGQPCSMTLMGGPVDTRTHPTAVNRFAQQRGMDWFRNHVIATVPWAHPGAGRRVYPGFLQLGGFMAMNLERHVAAHRAYFRHLVVGDGDSARKHRAFYDEYRSVMDLTAEFYLDTVERIFIRHDLPRGVLHHRGRPVRPAAITGTALMTVEAERDDISGLGQTRAAHVLCANIPNDRRVHHVQPGVGHYGVFNGARWRRHIAPRVADFIRRCA